MALKSNKDLLQFIYGQMEKLDKQKINIEEAKAQANLAKQANNIMKHELDRINTILKIDKHNREAGTDFQLRTIESGKK